MAAIKVTLFVALVFVLYGETEGFCGSDYECPGIQVCCNSECRSSCATEGEFCMVDPNFKCDDSLYCCDYKCMKTCIGQRCTLDSECGSGNYCCNYECRGSCDGHSCFVDRNCGDKKYCCNDICRDSCVGHRCDFKSDCGGDDEYCCNDKCQKGKCSLAFWAIVMIVFGVFGSIALIAGAAFSYHRSNYRTSQGIIVAAPFTRMPATTVAGTSNMSSYAHLPTPPAFQTGEPSEGAPPQYKQ